MAKCFTGGTVLPYEPIEQHTQNLWSVSGITSGRAQRRMTIAPRSDGKLLLHNVIALSAKKT